MLILKWWSQIEINIKSSTLFWLGLEYADCIPLCRGVRPPPTKKERSWL